MSRRNGYRSVRPGAPQQVAREARPVARAASPVAMGGRPMADTLSWLLGAEIEDIMSLGTVARGEARDLKGVARALIVMARIDARRRAGA